VPKKPRITKAQDLAKKTKKDPEPLHDTRSAAEVLEGLLGQGFRPDRMDQYYDTFKLMGVVLGQLALLRVVTNPLAEDKDLVSAAKALTSTREDPDQIADRLRASSLSDLTVDQLRTIISQIEAGTLGSGKTDLQQLIHSVKEKSDAS